MFNPATEEDWVAIHEAGHGSILHDQYEKVCKIEYGFVEVPSSPPIRGHFRYSKSAVLAKLVDGKKVYDEFGELYFSASNLCAGMVAEELFGKPRIEVFQSTDWSKLLEICTTEEMAHQVYGSVLNIMNHPNYIRCVEEIAKMILATPVSMFSEISPFQIPPTNVRFILGPDLTVKIQEFL